MNTAGPERDDAGAEPGAGRSSSWLLIAAAFLALEGITTIAYAGFLPPPIIDAGVTVPVLGRLPFVWLATGGLALVAAVGVFRKRTWGRYLGTVSAILAIVGALTTATSVPSAAIALAFPLLILFALWRRWPVPATT
jgi:hypothetical protein